jgi:O-antigen/teichoic acid export membrane protein
MANLGLGNAINRYVPVFRGQDDQPSLRGTIQVGIGLPFLVSCLLGGLLFLMAEWLALQVFEEPALTNLFQLGAIAVPFGSLLSSMILVTQSFKQMQYNVFTQSIFMPLAKILFVLALAVVGFTAQEAVIVHVVVTIMAAGMITYFLNGIFPLLKNITAAQRNYRAILAHSLPVYASRLMDMFGSNLQTFLLGILNTATAVGIFTAAFRVSVVGKMFHQSVVVISMPIVSDLYDKEDWLGVKHFYQLMTKWTLTFNLPLFLIILLFPDSILSLFGEAFEAGAIALIILALGNLLDASTGICGVIINMTGNTWLNIINSVLVLVLTIVLNVLLVPTYGVLGAAIAIAAAVSAVNFARLLEVFFLFRILPYNFSYLKPLSAGAGAGLITYLLSLWVLPAPGLLRALLGATILGMVYIAFTLALGLSDDDRMVLARMGNRFNRFRKR